MFNDETDTDITLILHAKQSELLWKFYECGLDAADGVL